MDKLHGLLDSQPLQRKDVNPLSKGEEKNTISLEMKRQEEKISELSQECNELLKTIDMILGEDEYPVINSGETVERVERNLLGKLVDNNSSITDITDLLRRTRKRIQL